MQNFAPPDAEKKSIADANPMIRQYNITFQVGYTFIIRLKAVQIHCD